jgi:hypothetical protein
MKISGLFLNVLLASTLCAFAQVTVEVTQEQEQLLPGEAIQVAVRITNLSGQELHLGQNEDWLNFALESRDGIVVPKLGEVPVVGPFTLESSKVAIKRVDLEPYFLLTRPGNFQIVATVHIGEWNRDIISPPKNFDLIQGIKLWEEEVGVPKTAGAAESQPETRHYILQQANNSKGRIRLYLRVTDPYGKTIRVVSLGPMVSFGRPESQVDKLSNVHVLSQEGPFAYNYTVCNLEGEMIARQSYDYGKSRPHLRVDDEGTVSVSGGNRRVAQNDIPPPKEDAGDDSPTPSLNPKPVPSTNQPPPPNPPTSSKS